MTTLYIVRHCQAKANVDKIFQGRFDGEITKTGERQLELLANRFKDKKIDVVYSSYLTRAMLTAKAVTKYNNAPIIIDEDLAEIDVGDLERMSISLFEESYPEEYNNWFNNPKDFVAPNGESMTDVYNRAKKALCNIINEQNQNKTIAIVSHGCLIRTMFCHLLGVSIEEIDKIKILNNTAVAKIQVNDNGEYNIIYERDVSHFDDDMKNRQTSIWYEKQE